MKHYTNQAAAGQTSLLHQIDWFTTLVPFLCILAVSYTHLTLPTT